MKKQIRVIELMLFERSDQTSEIELGFEKFTVFLAIQPVLSKLELPRTGVFGRGVDLCLSTMRLMTS